MASSYEDMLAPLLQGIGTGVTVAGDLSTGTAGAAAARFNANTNEQNASIVEAQGRDAVVTQQRLAYLTESAGRAGYGASGIRLTGSPLDVLEASATQAEIDKQRILWNAHIKASGFRSTAELDRMKATGAETQGIYKAGADALLGAAQAYKLFSGAPGSGNPLPGSGNVLDVPPALGDPAVNDVLASGADDLPLVW